MTAHISNVIKSCYCHLWSFGKLWPFWPKMRWMSHHVQAGLLSQQSVGPPANQLNCIQKVQNAAAVLWPEQSVRITLPLSCSYYTGCLSLNGLSTKSCVWCVHKTALQDLQEPVSPYSSPHSLFLIPVQTEHLWIWQEHKQKGFRSKVFLLFCTHPLE